MTSRQRLSQRRAGEFARYARAVIVYLFIAQIAVLSEEKVGWVASAIQCTFKGTLVFSVTCCSPFNPTGTNANCSPNASLSCDSDIPGNTGYTCNPPPPAPPPPPGSSTSSTSGGTSGSTSPAGAGAPPPPGVLGAPSGLGGTSGAASNPSPGLVPLNNPNPQLPRNTSFDPRSKGTNDQCSVSAGIDAKYGCNSTITLGQTAMMSNMATMTMGSAVAQSTGQAAQLTALQTGSQADTLKASATAQETTGGLQSAIGGMNALFGVAQIYKAKKHQDTGRDLAAAGKDIDSQTQTDANFTAASPQGNLKGTKIHTKADSGFVEGRGIGKEIIDAYKLNEASGEVSAVTATNPLAYKTQLDARIRENKEHLEWVKEKAGQVGREAKNEQQAVASQAMMQGMMSTMVGAQQITSAGFSLGSAAKLRAQAKQLENQKANTQTPFIQIPGPPPDVSGGPSSTTPPPITGSGVDGNAAPADSTVQDVVDGDLGKGFSPFPVPSTLPESKPPGEFKPGLNGEQGGAGNAPLAAGGAGTSPATPDAPDAPPKLGNKSDDSYMAGGAFTSTGGGKGAEGGPDLTSFLEKLLPKKEDADKPQNSILQWGSQGSPGSQGFPAYRAEDNLFGKVSEKYADKAQKGYVGI